MAAAASLATAVIGCRMATVATVAIGGMAIVANPGRHIPRAAGRIAFIVTAVASTPAAAKDRPHPLIDMADHRLDPRHHPRHQSLDVTGGRV